MRSSGIRTLRARTKLNSASLVTGTSNRMVGSPMRRWVKPSLVRASVAVVSRPAQSVKPPSVKSDSYASNNGVRSGATLRTVSELRFAKRRSVITRARAGAKPGALAMMAYRPRAPLAASLCTTRAHTARTPKSPTVTSPRSASRGPAKTAANCAKLNRCQPNAAPLFRATSRASSFAASSVAARIRISSADGRVSSHARATRIRL
jgi:hypothetical protein